MIGGKLDWPETPCLLAGATETTLQHKTMKRLPSNLWCFLIALIFKVAMAASSLSAAPSGTVVAWGLNDSSQTSVPVNLSGVTAIAAGTYHTAVLKNDSTVTAWGGNGSGQTTIPAGLNGVIAIAIGDRRTMALRSDGTVVMWGYNSIGQANVPAGLAAVKAIAAGVYHNVGLKGDGTVVAWGDNGNGQTNVPSGLSSVTAIAAGGDHSLALKSDGTVAAWGNNGSGQTTIPLNLSGVKAIAAGGDHSVALKTDGTVVAWGNNAYGQRTVPAGLSGVIAVAAGYFHTLALKSDGTVVAWGRNDFGQTIIPSALSGVTAIVGGYKHSVALAGTGAIAPSITTQPASQTTVAGTTITLSVTASGSSPLTYQWRREGTNLNGATGTTLVLNAAQPGDSGYYSVVITNPNGSTTSTTATINVLPVGASPNRVLNLDGSGDFVTIPSAADLQDPDLFTLEGWFYPVANAANTNPHFINKGDGQSGGSSRSYELGWTPTDGFGATVFLGTSTYATLSTPAPAGQWTHIALTYESTNRKFCLYKNGLLTTSTTNTAAGLPLTGQPVRQTTLPLVFGRLPGVGSTDATGQMDEVRIWSRVRSPEEIAGAMFCRLAGNEPGLAGYWTFDDGTASDRTGHGHHGVLSGDATTTLLLGAEPLHTTNQAPCITSQPQSLTVGIGQNASFAVTAVAGTNTGPFSYQWRKDGTNLAGATSSTYGVTSVGANQAGSYTVIVSNTAGSVTSAPPAVLTVDAVSDSRVVAWGDNAIGQTNIPSRLSRVTTIAAGGFHNVVLKSDGTVLAWGAGTTSAGVGDEYGQSIVPAGLSGVSAISAGGFHTVVLRSNGTVVAWGHNVNGQTTIPAGLNGVTAIAAGAYHTVALKGDGTVVAWGLNDTGQTNVPAGLSGVTAIAAGAWHTVALKSDGSVVAWGHNFWGQTTVPAGLSGVTAIAAGAHHCAVLKDDGTIVAWGLNDTGQTNVPAGLSGVRSIAAGFLHTVALKFDGSMVAWGAGMTSTTNSYDKRQSLIPVGLNGVVAIAAGHSHTLALIGGSPTLTMFPTGNGVSVVWPASATGYRLESSPNVSLPVLWSAEAASLQTNGGTISLTVPVPGLQKFFRLVKP